MKNSDTKVAILKPLWGRKEDGRWDIRALKGIALKPQIGFDPDFFKIAKEVELFDSSSKNIHEILASFGPTDFLLKQSILPVVAWVENEEVIRCIGTAFVISCTGYIITACHVLLDPKESNYGTVIREGTVLKFMGNLHMGVLIPISPAYGMRGHRFFPFVKGVKSAFCSLTKPSQSFVLAWRAFFPLPPSTSSAKTLSSPPPASTPVDSRW
jgi:hypothetical protein